ncbi:hypothetical protein A9Z40_03260 [Microbacterium arborescens]|uniref:Uncharacterized protein n=1 Tax=Microbacterium arborescens TaxID=33883 RepID=A0ABX2WIP2_9MICO|nr:hypothetical protein [Microbacterium arborescens]OAZ40974.1 hypothetical protein A9Z40_03260 [Microbacterium arborescens]
MTVKPYDEDAYLERFHAEYLSPDDAGVFLDRGGDGEGGYIWSSPAHSTEDAVADLFSTELDDEQLAQLAATLNDSYGYWAKRDEL